MGRMDEKGVSPVIGVILMVAITVILAAVIASFVFGMTGTISKPKTPGIGVYRPNSSYVEFTLYDKGGALNITNCTLDGGSSAASFGEVGSKIAFQAPIGRHVLACEVDGVRQVVWEGTI